MKASATKNNIHAIRFPTGRDTFSLISNCRRIASVVVSFSPTSTAWLAFSRNIFFAVTGVKGETTCGDAIKLIA